MNVWNTFCICKTKTCDLCFVHAGFHWFHWKMALVVKLHRTTTLSIFAMFVEYKLICVFEGDFPLSLNGVRS